MQEDLFLYICYYEGKDELWGRTLAKRVKELLGAYGLEKTYDADDNVIKDMGDDELRQILRKQKNVIIVVSKKLFQDIVALAELSIIGQLWKKREVHVFVIENKKQSIEFPNWAQWMKETTRFKVGEDTDIVAAVTLMLEKYWSDKIVSSMAQLKCTESMKDCT